MAIRMCFISTPDDKIIFKEVEIEFKYYSGFAISQKQKSIEDMHNNINKLYPELKVLEISTKSPDSIGVALSAFNLKFYNFIKDKEYFIENVFQSSKVFELGGPFIDLLEVEPRDAKRDGRLKNSGNLKSFIFNSETWELEPKTMFYDWIYISALNNNDILSKEILNYNAFTDIEFNHLKSINCQARAAAIFVSLKKNGSLKAVLSDKLKLKEIYNLQETSYSLQTSLFD